MERSKIWIKTTVNIEWHLFDSVKEKSVFQSIISYAGNMQNFKGIISRSNPYQ